MNPGGIHAGILPLPDPETFPERKGVYPLFYRLYPDRKGSDMLYNILQTLEKNGLVESARAHCDIPCGVYDPAPAQIAALSVVRLMDIMHEGKEKHAENSVALSNLLVRSALKKEEEAEKVKHEIRIIWGDYFKGPLLEQHPGIHALTHKIMQKAGACKQDVHREDGVGLVELVNSFAEIFWKTKGKETRRVTAPYPPGLEVICPQL